MHGHRDNNTTQDRLTDEQDRDHDQRWTARHTGSG
jgi:hypothetical protein